MNIIVLITSADCGKSDLLRFPPLHTSKKKKQSLSQGNNDLTFSHYLSQRTVQRGTMYIMMYAQRESISLREMLMNTCKWRQDVYSEDQTECTMYYM